MSRATQTRKKAATRPKNGQSEPNIFDTYKNELKTAAKAIGKQKINCELIKTALPYFFETYRTEKHAVSDMVTRVRIGALLDKYLIELHKTRPLCISPFFDVFRAWTECEPVAAIAARFGLSLQTLHTITAYCINTLCRQSLDYAHENNLQPQPYIKTDSELLAELYAQLGIEQPKRFKVAAARLPQSVKQGFAALGLSVPKIDFGRFSTLPTAQKSFIWLERCRKKLKYMPQTPNIKQLTAVIEREKTKLLQKDWYSEKH